MLMIELWQVPIGCRAHPDHALAAAAADLAGKPPPAPLSYRTIRARAGPHLEKDGRLARRVATSTIGWPCIGLMVPKGAFHYVAMALVAAVVFAIAWGGWIAELLATQESLAVLDNLLLDAGR